MDRWTITMSQSTPDCKMMGENHLQEMNNHAAELR